jgi:hypothetical protein
MYTGPLYASLDVLAVIGAWGTAGVVVVVAPGAVVVGVTAATPPGPLAARASEALTAATARLQITALQVRIHTATTSFVGLRG